MYMPVLCNKTCTEQDSKPSFLPLALDQLVVTFTMHRVPTFHDGCVLKRVEQILQIQGLYIKFIFKIRTTKKRNWDERNLVAYRTMMPHGIFDTEVIVA